MRRLYLLKGSLLAFCITGSGVASADQEHCFVGANLDFLPNSTAGIGDINGDAVPDILAGTSIQDGRYVIISGATGASLRDVDGSIEGQGCGVAAYGDSPLDPDNVPDYLVGAPMADPGGRTNAGEVRLFSGATGAILQRFSGPVADEFIGCGQAIATVGDVNGDGVADVAVGSPNADPGALSNAGKIYLFLGQNGALLWTSTEGAIFAGDQYGSNVDGIGGDVNSDGIPDLITGTSAAADRINPGSGNAAVGEARIISGADGTTIHFYSIANLNGRIGKSVTGMGGDVDADGVSDAAFGADFFDLLFDSQQLVIVSGATGNVIRVIDETQLNAESGVSGHVFNQAFSIDSLGDVNNDGVPDLGAGAPSYGVGGFGQGALAIYSLPSGDLLQVLQTDRAQNAIPREQLGRTVSGIGDINGDGTPDIAGGAPFFEELEDSNGRVCSFVVGPFLDCDVEGDGNVDRDDISAIMRARRTPASGPNDPRDVDGDGMITSRDAKQCISLCTNANCAR